MRVPRNKAQPILQEVKEKFTSARIGMIEKIDQWVERMAFYRGFQYTVRDGGWAVEDPEPTGEAAEVRNYIRPHVRAAVAARARRFPNPAVPAATGDQESMARAEATEKLLRSFVDDNVVNKEEIVRALYWAATVGGAWLKPFWDPQAGKLVQSEDALIEKTKVDETSGEEITVYEEEKDKFGEPIVSREYEGQIKVEFVDTIDGLPDPTAKRLSEMRYWIHRKMRPVEELERKFPKDYWGEKTKGRFGTSSTDAMYYEREAVAGNDIGEYGQIHGTGHEGNQMVELIEYWEGPSSEHPNGVLLVYSGDVVIHIGANPLKPCRLPVVLLLGDNLVASGLYADGVVADLIPLQKTLNRIESKKREWIDKVITPHILNPLGSNVDEDLFGEVIGKVIDYTPGLRPEVMNVPNIPQSMFEADREIVGGMKEISSYSDISRGDVPTGIESGRAIAFLKEQETGVREPDMMIHDESMLDLLRHCYYLGKQFYEDGRLIRTLGPEGWQYMAFKDEEFDWFIDLAPEAMSGGPNSRALRFAETMEAFTAGLFNDEIPGAKDARRLLSFDSADRSTINKNKNHQCLARMENVQFLNQQPINEVKPYHDDAIHLEEHNDLRNTSKYENLPPEVRAVFDAHCEMHEFQLQQKMGIFSAQQGMLTSGGQPNQPSQSGQESPMDGGSSAGEGPPETIDQYVDRSEESGQFPPG